MQRLLFLFLILMFCSCQSQVNYEYATPVYHTGDNQMWADRLFNDNNWSPERGNTGNHVFWVRLPVKILANPVNDLGLQLEFFGANEVFWDGVYIGSNGKTANKQGIEIPGTSTSYFSVPDSIAKAGAHVIALRASQSHLTDVQRGVDIKLDNYVSLLRRPLLIMSFMNLMAGAFLIAAIYYFFLYLNSRNREYTILIFAIICLLFFVLLIIEYVKFYIDIPYPKFYLRLEIIGWLTFVIAMLVPLYFSIQFNFRHKKPLLIILFITLIILYIKNYGHYDLTALLYSLMMWIAVIVIVLDAILQKEKGAFMVLCGLIVSVIVNHYLVYDFSLFISFTIIILCMLYLHAIRMRIIEEQHESSLLLSSRLQLELIKKNIQPHFLKNTLTSLIDWVEESPKQGAEFIQALAGEFDIMNSIAEAVLIPVRQEIELCKTHLTVMQFRKEICYEWEESGIDENAYIPPAIIHTLLENGITHSIPLSDGSVHFKLSYLQHKDFSQLTFETIAQNREVSKNIGGGNGFRYIRARLKESYGENWEFTSDSLPTGWLSTIKIYNR